MKNLTINEFEIMLEATGYLPPSNEDELAFFDQMYEDYKPRTVDRGKFSIEVQKFEGFQAL